MPQKGSLELSPLWCCSTPTAMFPVPPTPPYTGVSGRTLHATDQLSPWHMVKFTLHGRFSSSKTRLKITDEYAGKPLTSRLIGR